MKITDYLVFPMAEQSSNALPWILLTFFVLLRLIGVLVMMFWPPNSLNDYALRSRACLDKRIRDSLYFKNGMAETLWNRLISTVNVCSYNPDLKIEEYKSASGLRLFYVSNRNPLIVNKECSIVSVNDAVHADAEEKLAIASGCKFYASDQTIHERLNYHTGAAPWKVVLYPDTERSPLAVDLHSLLALNFGVSRIDNLIVGPFELNREYRELLWENSYVTYASQFCQVNLIYQRTRLLSLANFLRSFHDLLYASSFFTVKISKSADNRYLNVFAINFMESYCIERYLESTHEFQKKI